MNLLFRCDASLAIGNGHLMRCLTLATAWRSQGGDCRFVCKELPGNLLEHVRRQGFTALALPAGKPAEVGPGSDAVQDDDAKQTRAVLGQTAFDWTVVDHYRLGARWAGAMRSTSRRVMVIDDLADRRHDADLLLDQNLGRQAQDYAPHLAAPARLLIGPAFALLRPAFAEARADSLARRRHRPLRHLQISMGGVDAPNVTGRVLRALASCDLPIDVRIDVVMGPNAPWLHTVQQQALQMQRPTKVLLNPPDIATLMAESDLAIGGCGGTAWERCCLGLPSLVMVLADNQQQAAMALSEQGAVRLLPSDGALAAALEQSLRDLQETAVLQAFQQAASTVTDGKGVARVVAAMRSVHG